MTPERIAELRALCRNHPKTMWDDDRRRNHEALYRYLPAALDEIERLNVELKRHDGLKSTFDALCEAHADLGAESARREEEIADVKASEAYWKSRWGAQDAERMALRAQVDKHALEIERLHRRLDSGEVGGTLGYS